MPGLVGPGIFSCNSRGVTPARLLAIKLVGEFDVGRREFWLFVREYFFAVVNAGQDDDESASDQTQSEDGAKNPEEDYSHGL